MTKPPNYRPMENCGKCSHCANYSNYQDARCTHPEHPQDVNITYVCDDYE